MSVSLLLHDSETISPSQQVLCSIQVDSDTHTFILWLGQDMATRHYSRPSTFGGLIFLCIDPQHRESVQQALVTPVNRIIQIGIG
jgi:hypothetical protein